MNQQPTKPVSSYQRVRSWYAVLVVVFGVFAVRLFYLQVIRYDYYKKTAALSQLKEYTVPASRGTISAHMGDAVVPLVLNQKLYTLYVDPTLVKNASDSADKIQSAIGGNTADIKKQLQTKETRYVVLAKKITGDQSKKVLAFKLPGVGTQEQDYRTYPQGSTAAQLLGFVSDNGTGEYGLEQAENKLLAGTAGQLKAVTDINGVPLAASGDNLSVAPKSGDDLTLTIDTGMQTQVEQMLANAQTTFQTEGMSAVIMDPNTGAIKAMANYPSYDPANYQNVTDSSVFQNGAVTDAIEPGSIMKTLTAAAGIDDGAITATSTFYDPAHWLIDGFNVTDIEQDGGAGQQSIASTLNLSLNTGATWILMQMGGGQVNSKARYAWYNYMTQRFRFGQETGVEQGYESAGLVPTPQDDGAGINLTYANTSFGQALLVTPLQFAAAFSGMINGGTYYQPYLVDQMTDSTGKTTTTQPKVLVKNEVKPSVSDNLQSLMEYAFQQHIGQGYSYLQQFKNAPYNIGGKTGTAQLKNTATGKYYDDEFNGTYVGFVGGDKPQYVIVIYATKPHGTGYAGTYAGQSLFASMAGMLINNYGVTPKTK